MIWGKDMSEIKQKLMRLVNSNRQIRRTVKYLVRKFWRMQYIMIRMMSRTDEKLFVFEVYQGRQYACSPRAIYEELLKKEAQEGYHFIWVFREPEKYQKLLDNPGTSLVKLGTGDYYRAFAKAKYWVVNSRTRHCLVPGNDQRFLQTWHGTPLKRLGCDIMVEGNNVISASEMKKDYIREGERVTWFLSPSPFYSEKMASAFGLGKNTPKMVELGYPRNDSLFGRTEEDIAKIRERLGIPGDRKVILYAPTFRDNQHTKDGCAFTLGFELEHFVKELGQEYVMLFRTHYFVTEQVDLTPYRGTVLDVNDWDDINDLYLVSDLLITDYSSVFFDYANLKRPILFFMYDMEEYRDHIRDFYLNLDELPGKIIKTEQELYDAIRNVGKEPAYDERYQQFHNKFNRLDGPGTARTVIDWMLEKEQ